MARSEACGVFDQWALEQGKSEEGKENKSVEKEKKGDENKKKEESTVWVNLVGWTDIDAHMRFQASEDFKENVHYVAAIEGLKGMAMHHVKLEKV